MNYKTIGELGQNCAIGELSKYGLGIAPVLSDNYPFEFIIIADDKLFKAQVKTSTVSNDNNVAIRGIIMPEPFAIPQNVTSLPSILAFFMSILGTVSVVMMDSAKSLRPVCDRAFINRGIFAFILSMGSGAPMIPVEHGMTKVSDMPNASAAHLHISLACFIPISPVHALALPLLTTTA